MQDKFHMRYRLIYEKISEFQLNYECSERRVVVITDKIEVIETYQSKAPLTLYVEL